MTLTGTIRSYACPGRFIQEFVNADLSGGTEVHARRHTRGM